MNIENFLQQLSAKGRHSFTLDDAIAVTGKSRIAVTSALRRKMKQHKVAMPVRGFYLIVLPVFQRYDCLPAEYWIDDLMRLNQQPYYVGLLSAAKYYAAAHQKPHVFQVVVNKTMRSIQCGDVHIQFIKNISIDNVPIRKLNTPAAYVNVESPEALMIDLLRYPIHSGGMNNIATVLTELVESVNENKFVTTVTQMNVERVILQRLGFLLELVGADSLASQIANILGPSKLHTRALINGVSTKGCERNMRWGLYINYDVEPDL